jgi:predicted pyridoxine 5'-phosphate oxidase superfamily flavin-nucleotide-binding protein
MAARRTASKGLVPDGGLLVGTLERVDASDCFRTPVLAGDATDPLAWARAVSRAVPRWVIVLMVARNALVAPLGLVRAPKPEWATPFPLISRTDDELLMGLDDRHLNFRVSVRMLEKDACVSTTVCLNNRVGTAYWAVVRHIHPHVVAAIVRRIPMPVQGLPV